MAEIRLNDVLAISHAILIRFECSWAHFKAGGYRNAYPYPYPSLPVVLTRAGLKTRGIHYVTLGKLGHVGFTEDP